MKLFAEPNPIWKREMQQAARLVRTPFVLAGMTTFAGLSVCAAGGLASTSAPPAEVGSGLFQTFFSLAFAVVAWVGPGVAALTVVSERTGRTWESIVLTGMPPAVIARGKFLASLTYIGLYLAALAPVGALPFLFGGVTATEVVTGFALLGVFAVLSVGFGLAVSSGASTAAIALLVTLPLSASVSMFTYFGLGIGLSMAAHELWPGVTQGAPVWLPSAFARAPFARDYVIYLVVLPVSVTGILAGFFHAITVSNLSDPSDDRGGALKRWFMGGAATITVVGLILLWSIKPDRWLTTMFALGTSWLFSLSTLLILSSEPGGPSRRVLSQWARSKPGPVARFLGPGIARTALLIFVVTLASQLILAGAGAWAEHHAGGTKEHAEAVAVFVAYGVCFFGFLAGLAVFTRALGFRRLVPRNALALALVVATLGPLFIGAIGGVSWSSWDHSFAFAAASPLYVIAMVETVSETSPELSILIHGAVAMAVWAALGLVAAVVGTRILGERRRDTEAALRSLDQKLRDEDELARRAGEPLHEPEAS